jgi:hypothetical protein
VDNRRSGDAGLQESLARCREAVAEVAEMRAQLEAMEASKRAACERATAAERELHQRGAGEGTEAAVALGALRRQLHEAKEVRSLSEGCVACRVLPPQASARPASS